MNVLNKIADSFRWRFSYFRDKVTKKATFALLRLGSGNMFWARFYYFFWDKSFQRENRAVIKGKLEHEEGFSSGNLNEYKLRRNIHRIEKGLIMPDRKPVFAEGYLRETIKAFSQEIDLSKGEKNGLLKWAFDVLSLYFQSVDNKNDTVFFAFKDFKEIIEKYKFDEEEISNVPYYRKKLEDDPSLFSYESFWTLCKQRVSVRFFENKPVERELLDKAFKVALQSPSACNRQPFEFLVFTKESDIDKYIQLPGGVKGYEQGVPVLIFLIGDLSAYFDERDRHLIYIDGGLAAMSFMLALESLGLASCPLNWPDVEEREVKIEKELNMSYHKRCIMAFVVGYPDNDRQVPFSQKKGTEDVVKYF